MDVHFLTITLGANPDFAQETFYMEHMDEDGRRVEQLFQSAPSLGICIQEKSLPREQLRECLLSGTYLVIALVDKRKLSHPWAAADMCLPCCVSSGYTGHYVVVCGYDGARREFLLRDPASSSEKIWIGEEVLDEARMAFGTDEDLLLINTQLAQDLSQPPRCRH